MSDLEARIASLENESAKFREENKRSWQRSEALRFALGGCWKPHSEVIERANAFEAYLAGNEHASKVVAQVPQPQTAAPVVEQLAPPQSAAPTGAATATFEDCAAAFQMHVKKGNGRSAMTARKAIIDVLPHYQNFKALSPEECAVAVAAMDAA